MPLLLPPVSIFGINLPPLILAHATFMIAGGLQWIFTKPPKPSKTAEARAMAGIVVFAIGFAYLITGTVPMNQNMFLHGSVPVRMILAFLAGLRVLLFDQTPSGKREMLFVFLYDGLGGALCGYELDNFTGTAPFFAK